MSNRRAHGQSAANQTRTYVAWCSMKQRCYYPKYAYFQSYGGRGIKVCERWINSFENFFADMGECPAGLTLDRLDNDGDYELGNCQWATRKEQQRNRRGCRLLTHNGETRCLSEWAEAIGVKRTALDNRLRAGWPIAKALTTPAARPKAALEGSEELP